MAKSYILMGGRMLASGNEKRSWKSTRVVKLLGIDYPIIQAPFGGFPSQQLTAAVSNLGGLGSLGAVTLGSSAITEVIEEIPQPHDEALRDQFMGLHFRSRGCAHWFGCY